ncbi:MAG: molybdopterin-dependent oxidoreductase [Candidatus Bathyarchaeia archaeon]
MSPEKKKLPPGQTPIKRLLRWGTDHVGISSEIPSIKLETWVLVVDGEVEKPLRLRWNDILNLPKIESISGFHCVEGWSVLDCRWEGILFRDFVAFAKPKQTARFVTFECADGYTTSLSLEELSGDNVLLAYKLDGKELEVGLGFPLRLVVPDKYGYKSALWLTRIKFTTAKELGYWEQRGYSDTADVWTNDRFTK